MAINEITSSNNTQQISNIQQKEQSKSNNKSSSSTGTKVAIASSLVALAAAGIYFCKKGKDTKNLLKIKEQVENLTKNCQNICKQFNFETPQIKEKIEEILKLPSKEQIDALKQLEITLEHACAVQRHVDCNFGLPKGVKVLPENIRLAYEQKDVLKTGELFYQYLEKLPNARPAVTKGATVAETIENTFGKGTYIQPHTYDLSKESPVIGVLRDAGGYKNGIVGKEGRYYADNLTPYPDKKALTVSMSHGLGNEKNYGSMSELRSLNSTMLENPDRKLVKFIMPDDKPRNVNITISILSPDNHYTPLQQDVIKLMEHPENIDTSVLRTITEVQTSVEDAIEGNLYKKLDYDVLLSAIQSMAKKIK